MKIGIGVRLGGGTLLPGLPPTPSIGWTGLTLNENTPQGSAIGALTAQNANGPGAISISNVVPANSVVLDGDGSTVRVGAAIADYEAPLTQITFDASYSDLDGGPYTRSIVLPVNDINEVPTALGALADLSLTNAVAMTPVDMSGDFADPDGGDSLFFSIAPSSAALPAGLTFDGNSGILSGTPTANVTAASIIIRATDQGGLTVDSGFSLTVADAVSAPTNLAISATAIAEDAGVGAVVGTLSGTSNDGPITWSEVLDPDSKFTVVGNELRVDAALDRETSTSHDVTVRATNNTGSTDLVLTIAVNDVNEAPTGQNQSAQFDVTAAATTAPAAFTAPNWSVADKTTGGTLSVTILTLPDDGGSVLTDIEYSLDDGSWMSLGTTATGVYDISGLTNDQSYQVELRAVNAVGAAADSDQKNATPTSPSNPELAPDPNFGNANSEYDLGANGVTIASNVLTFNLTDNFEACENAVTYLVPVAGSTNYEFRLRSAGTSSGRFWIQLREYAGATAGGAQEVFDTADGDTVPGSGGEIVIPITTAASTTQLRLKIEGILSGASASFDQFSVKAV